jgi:hypothetical protein
MGRAVLTQPNLDLRGSIRPVTATLAPKSSGALRVWGAFVLLMVLVTLPLFSTVLPPLFDYPNHLARMHILSEGGNAFYAVRWGPLPNLAQDLIVPPLARLMSLETASKLFLVMIFGLIAGGTIWLNRVATGVWRLWPLLGFLLLYNRTFLWGFVNYLFGVGVALGSTALWLALERRRWWLRVLVSSLLALVCYFSHIAAFGFYALVILGIELSSALSEIRARRWRVLGRRIAVAGGQFVIPASLFLGAWRQKAAGAISYTELWRKADLLFSVFDNYNRTFDIFCFALFLGLIGWLASTKRLHLVPRLGWAIGVAFVAYLLLPSQMYGGSGADHRLPTALFLLLIASSAPRFPGRPVTVAIGTIAAAVLVVRMAVIDFVWHRADRVYSVDLAGIEILPRGAKLAVAYPASAVNFVPIPEVHLATLAIPRREAFVPTLFALPAQQPVVLRPPYDALSEATQPERLWAAFVGGDDAELTRVLPALEQYDYVAFTDHRSLHVPRSRCLGPVFAGATFQIFAVLHHFSCASPGG